MYNVQQVIDRYKGKIDERNNVTGYLAFGGHKYYLINSDIPISINSDGMTEFITNKKGQVQLYELLDITPKIIGYYKDYDCAERVTKKEIKAHPEWEEWTDYFPKWNDEYAVKKYWGETIDKYYLHPWFPDKEIVAFEVIRIMPNFIVGEIIKVNSDKFKLELLSKNYCLQYPEFFKPINK